MSVVRKTANAEEITHNLSAKSTEISKKP